MIGRMTAKEKGEHVSYSMALQCFDTSLHYIGQRGFEYSDSTAARKICTAEEFTKKKANIKNYFSK
jgi:hypothetical protein